MHSRLRIGRLTRRPVKSTAADFATPRDLTGQRVTSSLIIVNAHLGDPTIRRQIAAVAYRLLALDATTPVARIAAEAGVSRATFYRHFGSRPTLLAAIHHEPPPDARTRILEATAEMLVRTSLASLSMDDLARAADVSRGTLYRIFPGKPALFRGMVEAYSPFESMVSILRMHPDDPPAVVLPLIARAIVGVAGARLGLVRAVFEEATSGSAELMGGVRPVLVPALGALAEYLVAQMLAGRMRRVHPLIAIQAFVGPIYFHLMTRSLAEDLFGLSMSVDDAVDDLVAASQAGLTMGIGNSGEDGRGPWIGS